MNSEQCPSMGRDTCRIPSAEQGQEVTVCWCCMHPATGVVPTQVPQVLFLAEQTPPSKHFAKSKKGSCKIHYLVQGADKSPCHQRKRDSWEMKTSQGVQWRVWLLLISKVSLYAPLPFVCLPTLGFPCVGSQVPTQITLSRDLMLCFQHLIFLQYTFFGNKKKW